MKCEICGEDKICWFHPIKNELSCVDCYNKTYFKNGKMRKKVLKMIKLKDEEWDLLADYIKDNTCGCIYSTFTGNILKEKINKLQMTPEQKIEEEIKVLQSQLLELRAKKGVE